MHMQNDKMNTNITQSINTATFLWVMGSEMSSKSQKSTTSKYALIMIDCHLLAQLEDATLCLNK